MTDDAVSNKYVEPHIGTCECGHADHEHWEQRPDGQGFICGFCPCDLLAIPMPRNLMPGVKVRTYPNEAEAV